MGRLVSIAPQTTCTRPVALSSYPHRPRKTIGRSTVFAFVRYFLLCACFGFNIHTEDNYFSFFVRHNNHIYRTLEHKL